MTATKELNPRELLSQFAESSNSGCLELNENNISWKIYLSQGSLQYINCSAQSLEQLKYYLHYLQFKPAVKAIKNLPSSLTKKLSQEQEKTSKTDLYGQVISWLIVEKYLARSEFNQLIEYITKDLLRFCLWLNKGAYTWYKDYTVPLWMKTQFKFDPTADLDIFQCLKEEHNKLRQWQTCSDRILSVYQRPYFPPGWENKPLPTSGSLDLQNLKELTKVLKGRTSIRQLSILLHKNELDVARILSPYIDSKIIYLNHASSPLDQLPIIPRTNINLQKSYSLALSNHINININNQNNNSHKDSNIDTWKIVCIDDSPTILNEMQRFLDQSKFQVTTIDDPVQAVSTVFRVNPDLILLDITMPKINGYRLCSLLRSSGSCDKTPIIMVTGNTGLIDKARAKLSGATDYFTKPFTKRALRLLVEKHLLYSQT